MTTNNVSELFGTKMFNFGMGFFAGHVTHTTAFLADLTWEDVISLMAVIFAVNFCVLFVLLVTVSVIYLIRRRR